MRSLASAKNEQARRSWLPGAFKESCTHRDARHLAAAKISPSLLKMHSSCRHEWCHHSVRKPGHEIRFKDKSRNSTHNRRQHLWPPGVSTDPNHHVRTKFSQNATGIPHRSRQAQGSLQPRRETHVFERADLHQSKGKSRRRNQSVLDATRGPNK